MPGEDGESEPGGSQDPNPPEATPEGKTPGKDDKAGERPVLKDGERPPLLGKKLDPASLKERSLECGLRAAKSLAIRDLTSPGQQVPPSPHHFTSVNCS